MGRRKKTHPPPVSPFRALRRLAPSRSHRERKEGFLSSHQKVIISQNYNCFFFQQKLLLCFIRTNFVRKNEILMMFGNKTLQIHPKLHPYEKRDRVGARLAILKKKKKLKIFVERNLRVVLPSSSLPPSGWCYLFLPVSRVAVLPPSWPCVLPLPFWAGAAPPCGGSFPSPFGWRCLSLPSPLRLVLPFSPHLLSGWCCCSPSIFGSGAASSSSSSSSSSSFWIALLLPFLLGEVFGFLTSLLVRGAAFLLRLWVVLFSPPSFFLEGRGREGWS